MLCVFPGHALQHFDARSGHAVAISVDTAQLWCYACDLDLTPMLMALPEDSTVAEKVCAFSGQSTLWCIIIYMRNCWDALW